MLGGFLIILHSSQCLIDTISLLAQAQLFLLHLSLPLHEILLIIYQQIPKSVHLELAFECLTNMDHFLLENFRILR